MGLLSRYNVPIVADVDIGHLSPRIPIVSGAFARVSASGNELKIETVLK